MWTNSAINNIIKEAIFVETGVSFMNQAYMIGVLTTMYNFCGKTWYQWIEVNCPPMLYIDFDLFLPMHLPWTLFPAVVFYGFLLWFWSVNK